MSLPPIKPGQLRVISLWEPWASLWCSGVKIHETRHWWTGHRGPLVVHAAKKWTRALDRFAAATLCPAIEEIPALVRRFGAPGKPASLGTIVGVVDLAEVVNTTVYGNDGEEFDNASTLLDRICGDWSPGRYAWRAESPVLFADPIPYRGRQGIWTLEDDVAEQVRERLAA